MSVGTFADSVALQYMVLHCCMLAVHVLFGYFSMLQQAHRRSGLRFSAIMTVCSRSKPHISRHLNGQLNGQQAIECSWLQVPFLKDKSVPFLAELIPKLRSEVFAPNDYVTVQVRSRAVLCCAVMCFWCEYAAAHVAMCSMHDNGFNAG
jgi:hypothetical protein